MIFQAVVFAVLAVALVATIVLAGLPAFQAWELGRTARRVGLGVPADLADELMRRMRVRLRWGAAGGLVGVAVSLALVVLTSALDDGSPRWSEVSPSIMIDYYGVLAVTLTGSALAVAWSSLRSALRSGDGPRIARARPTRVADYVPPQLHWLAVFALGMALIAVVMNLGPVATLRAGVTVPAVALGGLGALAIVVYEIASRVVVGRGQPAVSTDELVWSDALRSLDLRDLLYGPLFAMSLGASWLVAASVGAASWFTLIPAGLGFAALIGFRYIQSRTYDWYLATLWPGSRRRTPDEEARRLAEARRLQEAATR
ncbi:hypothetical protein AX769_06800 [Frondihabitans sp. PAMC 28766]|uniref:hypothetical protein n=1 Tax=Frondihabitans sp. PAMC 28766 TaxID=1795630 RepID=UPI00078BA43D|nr:hypothetical protein [Frondihabitans sp. PAMC 28766]AMM19918.1 hypothetical protein AX769_06800 [Frondihabitans sp. PAMC 28766]